MQKERALLLGRETQCDLAVEETAGRSPLISWLLGARGESTFVHNGAVQGEKNSQELTMYQHVNVQIRKLQWFCLVLLQYMDLHYGAIFSFLRRSLLVLC